MKRMISILLLGTVMSALFVQDILLAQRSKGDKYSLGVLNLNAIGDNIPRTDVSLVSARLTEELNNTGLFHIMSHRDMERGLFNKNLDPAGCAAIECAVRAGTALGVQLVVFGTIRQNASSYAVDLQMIHISSKAVVKDYRDNIEGDLNDLYSNMRFVAQAFMGLAQTQSKPEAKRETLPPPTQEPVTETFPTPEKYPPTETYPVNEPSYESGGGFRWAYVGLGLLVAGGVGAGVLLAQKGSDSTPGGNGTTIVTPNPLPGPPTFP